MAMTILHVYRGGMGDAGGDGGGSGEKVLYVGSAPPGYRQQYYRHVNAHLSRSSATGEVLIERRSESDGRMIRSQTP